MRPGLAAREQRRACRLDRRELHIRIFLFEIASCAGECAARADASDEKIDAAVAIAPELGAGGEIVRLGICGIVKLCGDKALRCCRRQLLRALHGARHALRRRCQHQFRTVGFEQIPTLHAHALRHGEDHAVAVDLGHRGEADAGVAARRLNDDAPRNELSLRLGAFDHVLRHAVLGAARHVAALELGKDAGVQAVPALVATQLQQRGVSR